MRPPLEKELADDRKEKKQPSTTSEHIDHHLRLRALSESDHYQLQSGIGIHIPHNPPQRSSSLLSPPMSYSPVSIPSNSLYSTSAHLYSTDEQSLPDTPQSSITSLLESKRHPRAARASLGPSINKSGHNRRQTGDGYGLHRAVTYSYGSRQHSFVDASSFDSVPDSPAKMVPTAGIQYADHTSFCKALLRQRRQHPCQTTKAKKSAHTSSAGSSVSAVSVSSKKHLHIRTVTKSNKR